MIEDIYDLTALMNAMPPGSVVILPKGKYTLDVGKLEEPVKFVPPVADGKGGT